MAFINFPSPVLNNPLFIRLLTYSSCFLKLLIRLSQQLLTNYRWWISLYYATLVMLSLAGPVTFSKTSFLNLSVYPSLAIHYLWSPLVKIAYSSYYNPDYSTNLLMTWFFDFKLIFREFISQKPTKYSDLITFGQWDSVFSV